MKNLTFGGELKIKRSYGTHTVTEKVEIIEFGFHKGVFLVKVKDKKKEEFWVNGNTVDENNITELNYSSGNTREFLTKHDVN